MILPKAGGATRVIVFGGSMFTSIFRHARFVVWHTLQTFFIWICIASVASAVVVYDESVNGDVAQDPNSGPLLQFLPGSNLVQGSFGALFPSGYDYDGFRFENAAGDQLVSASLALVQSVGEVSSTGYDFYPAPFNSFIDNQIVPGSAPILTTILPLEAGIYTIEQNGMAYGGDPPAIADFTFDFEVQLVPEPSTIALLILAAIGVLARRPFTSLANLAS